MNLLNENTYSQEVLKQIWEKGTIISGYNASKFRKDVAGAWMKYDDYGNINSSFGWEIDHSNPRVLGGTDSLRNLRPLQWQNNRAKSNKYPFSAYPVTAEGTHNIKKNKA